MWAVIGLCLVIIFICIVHMTGGSISVQSKPANGQNVRPNDEKIQKGRKIMEVLEMKW